MVLNKNETSYLEKIFEAIPLMSDFEKGRLLGYAEALEMRGFVSASNPTVTTFEQTETTSLDDRSDTSMP